MATYEDDHNIQQSARASAFASTSRRQTLASAVNDLDSFFETRQQGSQNEISESNDPYIVLQRALERLASAADPSSSRAQDMISYLLSEAHSTPGESHGLPDSFMDSLERIPKKKLSVNDSCSICATGYLEDKYPLVVRLPCNDRHHFDLECIGPWLKLHSTCPLCRKDLAEKRKPPIVVPEEQEEEEDYDELYG